MEGLGGKGNPGYKERKTGFGEMVGVGRKCCKFLFCFSRFLFLLTVSKLEFLVHSPYLEKNAHCPC